MRHVDCWPMRRLDGLPKSLLLQHCDATFDGLSYAWHCEGCEEVGTVRMPSGILFQC
jgi:hypothetical protein